MAMQMIREEDEPLSEPRTRFRPVIPLPDKRLAAEDEADDTWATEAQAQAAIESRTTASSNQAHLVSAVPAVVAINAVEGRPLTREQHISDFIRAAEAGSHDILERFQALCSAYAGVKNELPPHVRAIVAALRKANALPRHMKPRDGRRGLDFGLLAAAKVWGLSREELEAFFDKAYLSRSMIAKMRQLAEFQPDFARARLLLEAAQRERRHRGEEEEEEEEDSDNDDGSQQGGKQSQGGLKRWTGVSKEAVWVPGDIERAMAAAVQEKQASGHDTNDANDFNNDNSDDTPPPSASSAVEVGRRFDPNASGQQYTNLNLKRRLADSLADSPVQILADDSFYYDYVAASGNDDDDDVDPDHRESPLTPTPAKRRCQANISHIRRRLDTDDGNKRLDLKGGNSPLEDSHIMLLDDGVESSPSPSVVLPPVVDIIGDTTPGQNPSPQLPLLLPPSTLRGNLAPSMRLSDIAIHGLLSVLTTPLQGQFVTIDPLIASSALQALSGHASSTGQILLVPVFVAADAHWVLAVIHRRAAFTGDAIPVDLYDSLPSPAHQCEAIRIVNHIYAYLFPDDSSQSQPCTVTNRLAHTQQNDFDCGLHVVVIAAYLIAGLGLPEEVNGPCWRHLFCSLLPLNDDDDDHDLNDINDNNHNDNTPTLQDRHLTTAKDWLQSLNQTPAVPQPPPLVGPSDNSLQSLIDTGAAHLNALSQIFNSGYAHATRLQTALTKHAQTVADASIIFRHIQVAAAPPNKDTHADELAASLHRVTQELTHWQHLAQLDDTVMPRETIQDGPAACQRRLAQIRAEMRTRARRQVETAESRRALRRAVSYCDVLRAHIAELRVTVDGQVKRLRDMRRGVDAGTA